MQLPPSRLACWGRSVMISRWLSVVARSVVCQPTCRPRSCRQGRSLADLAFAASLPARTPVFVARAPPAQGRFLWRCAVFRGGPTIRDDTDCVLLRQRDELQLPAPQGGGGRGGATREGWWCEGRELKRKRPGPVRSLAGWGRRRDQRRWCRVMTEERSDTMTPVWAVSAVSVGVQL